VAHAPAAQPTPTPALAPAVRVKLEAVAVLFAVSEVVFGFPVSVTEAAADVAELGEAMEVVDGESTARSDDCHAMTIAVTSAEASRYS
jgi:hypothetical protein